MRVKKKTAIFALCDESFVRKCPSYNSQFSDFRFSAANRELITEKRRLRTALNDASFVPAGCALLSLQKRIYVIFVDQGRTSIYERGDGCKAVFRPIGIERRRLVVIQVVQHLHAHKCHGVWLLGNRGGDAALLDPIQSVRIGIHSHYNFSRDLIAVKYAGHFFARLRLETDEGIDLILFLTDNLRSRIERDARIALDVDDARYFNSSAVESILVTA